MGTILDIENANFNVIVCKRLGALYIEENIEENTANEPNTDTPVPDKLTEFHVSGYHFVYYKK